MVAGKILLEDRRPTVIDEDRLHEQAAEIVSRRVEEMSVRTNGDAEQQSYVERVLLACEGLAGPPAGFAPATS